MPQNANGRPGTNPDRRAADSSHDGDSPQHNKILPGAKDPDPIRRLLDLLDAAFAKGGPIHLPDGRSALVRRVEDGCYAVEQRT